MESEEGIAVRKQRRRDGLSQHGFTRRQRIVVRVAHLCTPGRVSPETCELHPWSESRCDIPDRRGCPVVRHGEASTHLVGANEGDRFAGLPVQVACDPPALVVRCGDNDQRTGGRSPRLPEQVNSVLTEEAMMVRREVRQIRG